MKKGQIFWTKNQVNHKHPIVFLKAEDDENFLECILSKTDTNGNNAMLPDHFVNTKEDGSYYSIKYRNSHLVHAKVFIKKIEWLRRLQPDGMLTNKGIEFIEENLKDIIPEFLFISIKAASELN